MDCSNGGGTASGILQYGIVVIAREGEELIARGSLVPQRQPPAQLPTTLTIKKWWTRALTVEELWYRPGDATCCPSGAAEVTWAWRDGVPTPGPAHVLQ